jgi:hypothetical protein
MEPDLTSRSLREARERAILWDQARDGRVALLWSTATMMMTITGGELAYCSLASARVREKASVFSSNCSSRASSSVSALVE